MEDNKLVDRTYIEVKDNDNIISIIKDNDITTLICGGIAATAMQSLFEAHIKVIPGARGDVDVAISSLL